MRIDRWNTNTLRRYHLHGGSILVCFSDRDLLPSLIPAWCSHVAVNIDRDQALALLLHQRAIQRIERIGRRITR